MSNSPVKVHMYRDITGNVNAIRINLSKDNPSKFIVGVDFVDSDLFNRLEAFEIGQYLKREIIRKLKLKSERENEQKRNKEKVK